MSIKELMSSDFGIYSSERIANKYIVVKAPRKKRDGTYYATLPVMIKVPLQNIGEDGKVGFRTASYTYRSGESATDFIETVRAERDSIFEAEHNASFIDCQGKVPKKKKRKTTSGYEHVSFSRLRYQYVVSYLDGGTTRYSVFDVVGCRSDEKAYLKACRYSDEKHGELQKSDSEYLARKLTELPEVEGEAFWSGIKQLALAKEKGRGLKRGVEVRALVGSIGFLVNSYNRKKKQQERTLINAHLYGEDVAFVEACRLKDELDGEPALSDSEYLSLKPFQLFPVELLSGGGLESIPNDE